MRQQRQQPYKGWDITENPTQLWYPVQEPPQPKRRWGLFLTVFLVLFLVGALATAGFAIYLYSQSDRIVPGVEVAGVEVGGQTTADAVAALENQWRGQNITLQAGDQTWHVSAAELGISLNSEATIQQAYLQGRSVSGVERLLRSGGHLEIRPVWEFNPNAAQAYFQWLAPDVYQEAVDAGVKIENGRAVVVPPINGYELDIAATMNNLRPGPISVLENGRLDLVTRPVTPAIADTSAIAAAANQLLATNITIHAFDPITGETTDGVVTPEMWGSWLSLEILDAAGQFDWTVDELALQEFLTYQAQSFGPSRYLDLTQASEAMSAAINNQQTDVYVRVFYHDRQHVVQSGETLSSIGRDYGIPYPWLQQANPELAEGLFVGQTVIIPSPDALLPLPVVQNKRIIVSITQQRVWVYENGNLKWEWAASTGIDESPTAPGIFQIQSHEPNAYAGNWDLWMPNFMGVYRPVPTSDFMNGFHGFPTRNGSQLLWTNSLGRKVTYGCILLSSENAATLYDWAEEGVVVEIRP